MQVEPSAEIFAARYAAGEPQFVWTTLVADLETPVSAFLKIAGGRPMSFLLESVEGGAVRGRYSIIGLEPDMIFRVDGEPPRSTTRRAATVGVCADQRTAARRRCAPSSPKAASRCPMSYRPWPPACSAISATTWCG